MKTQILELVADSVDLKKLAKGLVLEIADEALQKVVDGTENELDNMAKAALWGVFEKEASKLIDEKLDLRKLLKLDEVSPKS